MKLIKKILQLTVLLTLANGHSQKLSLADLHLMSGNKNWETTNKYLLAKNWEFHNSEKGDSESYNLITWSYNKSDYGTERARGWLSVYTYEGLPNKVLYRFKAKEVYTAIRQQLTANKYKLQEEEVLDKRVIARYSNPNYILELNYLRVDDDEYSDSGSYTVYEVIVFKKGGIYDPDNGNKKEYNDRGLLTAEYAMKDGKVHGLVKLYNDDGTIHRTTYVIQGVENGPVCEYYYDDKGQLIGKHKGEKRNDVKSGKWQLNAVKDDAEINLSYTNYINDVAEGEFRKVYNDSVIYGNYKNGMLDGKYDVFFDFKKKIFGGIVQTDSTKIPKISTGYFAANKKIGVWKNFDLSGTLIESGVYEDSLKIGKWKYYNERYVNKDGVPEKYSGELKLIESYLNGNLNGETIRYSFFDEIETPCADDPTKVCTEKKYVKVLEKSNFRENILHGRYELRDADNNLMYLGEFRDGSEEGKWLVRSISPVSTWKGQTNETGNYRNGKKEGLWERRTDDEKLIETYNYASDLLDGEHLLYDNSGQLIEKRLFSAGEFQALDILDSSQNSRCRYSLDQIGDTTYHCIKTERQPDGIYTIGYSVVKKSEERILPSTFKVDFEGLSNNAKHLDGIYLFKTLDDKPIEEGKYISDKKVGKWSRYDYIQQVRLDLDYDVYGNLQGEYYYDFKRNEPFSGEYVYKDTATMTTEERKVKDGLRNGVTRVKDANDKTVKKQTFKDGQLKE